jgi:hypothetical protein
MTLKLFSIAAALVLVAACSDDTKTPQPEAQVTKDLKAGEPLVKVDVGKSGDGPKADAPKTGDGPKADAPKAADLKKTEPSPVADLPMGKLDATNLTCAQVSACSDTCAAACAGNFICLIGCPNTCGPKACTNSAAPWQALSSCITGKCIVDCAGGHTAGCATCVTTKCANEVAACNAAGC